METNTTLSPKQIVKILNNFDGGMAACSFMEKIERDGFRTTGYYELGIDIETGEYVTRWNFGGAIEDNNMVTVHTVQLEESDSMDADNYLEMNEAYIYNVDFDEKTKELAVDYWSQYADHDNNVLAEKLDIFLSDTKEFVPGEDEDNGIALREAFDALLEIVGLTDDEDEITYINHVSNSMRINKAAAEELLNNLSVNSDVYNSIEYKLNH